MSETVVLIHGLWMTPLSWEHWVDRFSERGHQVLAPAWPGMDRAVESLRSHYTVGEDGWEAVADHALEWAITHASKLATPH